MAGAGGVDGGHSYTEMMFVASHFTAEYMRRVNSRGRAMPTKFRQAVFCSRPLNLKLVDDRVEALRGLITLLRHLKTEECEDAFMAKVLKRV